MAVGNTFLLVLKIIIQVYDILTGWIYVIFGSPGATKKAYSRVRAVPTKPIGEDDTEVTYKPVDVKPVPLVVDFEVANNGTMAEVWSWAVKRHGSRKFLGTRDILGEDDEIQSNGKSFSKLELGDYRWMSYDEADSVAENVGRGLRILGQQSNKPLCIFADTRAEWMLTAQACFKQSFPIVTLYTNLGEDAIAHGLNETEVDTVITTHELLPKFKKILESTPRIKNIIFFENPIKKTVTTGYRENVKLTSFWDTVSLGKRSVNSHCAPPIAPTPESTCIIMYTSGSTGNPKGVIVTHENLVKSVNSYLYLINELTNMEITDNDLYIAYLPLAHVLELIAESMMMVNGVSIGYSTPNTLNDKSTMIKKGHKGDATILKPTAIACVPLVLERIYKGVHEVIKKKGDFFENLFDFCVKYKMAATARGEVTPIMDKLIFKNVRLLLGGRIRLILSGGAPLNPESHDFIRSCFGCPVLQGYGLTETTACATVMTLDENSTGRVGPPVHGINIRLKNWEEGNYRVTDKPRPRGEVLIGGGNITSGYYKQPEKTAEEYFVDTDGKRWYKSGDIGQVEEDGTLKIIDRKKDLIKLQCGEYVSLGKVESVLKTCSLVENICIYGDSNTNHVVALLCPDIGNLMQLAKKLGKTETEASALCLDKDVTGAVLRELVQYGKQFRLEKFEVPGAVTLCQELWTPESDLVTAAFKLKRKPIQQFYQADINRMYGV
eukprot:GFUD01018440.1.p1 GENE.GFUD01018440.1~~GFUD01018440.1.p1  ORF type:complete len:721 (+),score=167.25 GFUD01018440.1:139-2301(+)